MTSKKKEYYIYIIIIQSIHIKNIFKTYTLNIIIVQ